MNYRPWEDYERKQQQPPPVYIEPKVTAAYQASGLTDGVIIPILKSVFIGFTLGVLGGLLTLAFEWQVNGWLVFGITWFAVMPFSFWRYSERGQWLIERITGADLNNDGYIGQPMPPMLPPPAPIRVEVSQDQGRQVDYIDLPPTVTPEKMQVFARGVLGGRQFALSVWTGQHAIFSRSEFEALRSEFLARGLARWKNSASQQQGIELTHAGKAVLRKLANEQPHPTIDA